MADKVNSGIHKALVEVTLECRYLSGDDVLTKNVMLRQGDELYVTGIGIRGNVMASNIASSKSKDEDRKRYEIPLPVYFAAFEVGY